MAATKALQDGLELVLVESQHLDIDVARGTLKKAISNRPPDKKGSPAGVSDGFGNQSDRGGLIQGGQSLHALQACHTKGSVACRCDFCLLREKDIDGPPAAVTGLGRREAEDNVS